ncbi:MAG: PAS domain S-box protein [Bacteroidia bacterium]|nr:PAS domain S-box protein [Bacteroidia bacterium]
MDNQIDLLKRRLERERQARKQAENILESKAQELFDVNQSLKELNESLEEKVERRTKELLQKEKEYTTLVENANDIIYTTDEEGYFLSINNIGIEKLNLEKEDVLGKRYIEFIRPDYIEKVFQYYTEMKEKGLSSSYLEFPLLINTDQEIWIGQNVTKNEKPDGKIIFSAVARDITDRVESEYNLKKANTRFSSLLENMVAGILVEDQNRKIVLANSTFCKIFGIPADPASLVGLDCKNSAEETKVLFKDEEAFVRGIENLLDSRELRVGDELMMKDGRILSRNFIPIILDNEYQGHLWYYQDITLRRNQELMIKQSEEKYRGMMENMELGLMEVDDDGVIQKVYDRFAEMTGYTKEELFGKNANDLLLDEESRRIMSDVDNKRKKGKEGVYEIQVTCKDGKKKWMLISGSPFYDHVGKFKGTLGIHYDISDRKRLEDELIKARELAEKAQQAEQEYLANMSHEIRTPLNAITGMIHLLDETPLNNEQKEYIEILGSSSNILLSLISDILDISKIDAGTLEVKAKRFDMKNIAENLIRTYSIKAYDKDLNFDLKLDQIFENNVIGDPDLINQVLLNLMSNAEKFTSSGKIELTIQKISGDENESLIRFSVKDTGIGIEKEYVQNIFHNFKQASREIRDKYGGTGLGLTIAKKIVELLRGELKVDSELGSGSNFYFDIPLKLTDIPVTKTRISEEKEEQLMARILVVEDNKVNQKYITKLLEKWEYEYETVFNGQEALDLYKDQDFDLIFMDLQMPVMDGFETTKHIRNMSGPKSNIPIIALTASTFLSKKELALEGGMTDFISKPFKPATLSEMIKKQLRSQKADDNLSDSSPFSRALNIGFLKEIYEEDYSYAKEMFGLFLQSYKEELEQLDKHIEETNIGLAKRSIHKIKPSFGMVGLSGVSEKFDLMEGYDDIRNITKSYEEIRYDLEKLMPEVEATYDKLITMENA